MRRAAAAAAAKERRSNDGANDFASFSEARRLATTYRLGTTFMHALGACVLSFIWSPNRFSSYRRGVTSMLAVIISTFTASHLAGHTLCYGPDHLPLAAAAVRAHRSHRRFMVLVRIAPKQDLSTRELPHFAVGRTWRWTAPIFSVAQGELSWRPRGAAGVPTEYEGWSSTDHLMNDLTHLMLLLCACMALYAGNFRYQPRGVRGAVNASRGAYACANGAA